MTAGVVVRAAVPDDAPVLANLIRQFSREGGVESPMTADELRKVAFGPEPLVGVLVVGDPPAIDGYALFYPSYDTDHAVRGYYLLDLYVRSERRGAGLGRALMRHLARRVLADGGAYLFWNAMETNAEGRAFYRRIGAREEPVVTLSLQPTDLQTLASEL